MSRFNERAYDLIDRIPAGIKVAVVVTLAYLMAARFDAWCAR